MKTVLLYSGGMDSWLISKIVNPDIKLFFDLNTASSNAEKQRLSSDVVIDKTLRGLGDLERSDGSFILPLRNLYFITRAAEYGDRIILGTNQTDAHNDKTYEFAQKLEDVLNYYYGPSIDGLSEIKDIVVDFSFKKYSRKDLCRLYLESGGTVEQAINDSFSCYTPVEDGEKLLECHNCKACFNKMMGFYVNGVDFPEGYLKGFSKYLRSLVESYDDKPHRYYTKEILLEALKKSEKDESTSFTR